MELIIVESQKHRRMFNQLTRLLYRHDPVFISHLDKDIEAIFNPKKNHLFHNGSARRWLLKDKGKPIGKIAAFYNRESSFVGIGFFDCIEDREAAHLLFGTAERWLKEAGITQYQAPVNFGERDKYWGLLVEGNKHPAYQENYNAFYYRDLFESYGFVVDFEQSTAETNPSRFDAEKFGVLAKKIRENRDLEIIHLRKKELARFASDFVSIYNRAWSNYDFFRSITTTAILKMFQMMRPVLREDLIWFTYVKKEPVAFYVSILDINPILKYMKGKTHVWAKLKFLWYRKRTKISRIRGIVFGVVPEYQNRGIYSGMIMKIFEVFQKDPHLQSTELAWIGNFNPKMQALFRSLRAKTIKRHITYKKQL